MPWLLVGLAVVVLALAALAATGRGGQMPEPPVEDEWIEPDAVARRMVDTAPEVDRERAATDDPVAGDRDRPATSGVPRRAAHDGVRPTPATPGDDPPDLSLPDTR